LSPVAKGCINQVQFCTLSLHDVLNALKKILNISRDRSMAHLFYRFPDNITSSYYFSSLTKPVNTVKGLLFCHWIPLWFKKMNTTGDREV
jgi:hypothetical protein